MRATGILIVGALLLAASQTNSAYQQSQSPESFFATVIPAAIEDGFAYIEIPIKNEPQGTNSADRYEFRRSFFEKAVIDPDWLKKSAATAVSHYGGIVVDSRFLDVNYIRQSSSYQVGDVLQLRTPQGVFPARIVRHQINYAEGAGEYMFSAVAEIPRGRAEPNVRRVLAASKFADCANQCGLTSPAADKQALQKIRSVMIEKLGVRFPSDLPQQERVETLSGYTGHFTRSDRLQYVGFFARHRMGAPTEGEGLTVVFDADFTVLAVLGTDEHFRIIPEGLTDIDRDGLHEIWCDEAGYEGAAYSVWYVKNRSGPVSFGAIKWQYWGV